MSELQRELPHLHLHLHRQLRNRQRKHPPIQVIRLTCHLNCQLKHPPCQISHQVFLQPASNQHHQLFQRPPQQNLYLLFPLMNTDDANFLFIHLGNQTIIVLLYRAAHHHHPLMALIALGVSPCHLLLIDQVFVQTGLVHFISSHHCVPQMKTEDLWRCYRRFRC
jgi:hypothetical protein